MIIKKNLIVRFKKPSKKNYENLHSQVLYAKKATTCSAKTAQQFRNKHVSKPADGTHKTHTIRSCSALQLPDSSSVGDTLHWRT